VLALIIPLILFARFSATGHSPGPCAVTPAARNRDFPMTLDLRRDAGY
jgi:uncharacterized protein (DUF2126 family)